MSDTEDEEHPIPALKLPKFSDRAGATLFGDGATLVCDALSKKDAARVKKACELLRDAAGLSFLFSNPESKSAPPCGAECLWPAEIASRAFSFWGTAKLCTILTA